jgi:general secretion pathway protein M
MNARLQALRAAWRAREPRERRLVLLAGSVLGLYLLWALAVQPALRTLRELPPRLDAQQAQLQRMQDQAAEAEALRAIPPLPHAQALAALQAATARLGERARLSEQGERVVLTLRGVSGEELRDWLADARVGARARPVELRLAPQPGSATGALAGTLVLSLPQP